LTVRFAVLYVTFTAFGLLRLDSLRCSSTFYRFLHVPTYGSRTTFAFVDYHGAGYILPPTQLRLRFRLLRLPFCAAFVYHSSGRGCVTTRYLRLPPTSSRGSVRLVLHGLPAVTVPVTQLPHCAHVGFCVCYALRFTFYTAVTALPVRSFTPHRHALRLRFGSRGCTVYLLPRCGSFTQHPLPLYGLRTPHTVYTPRCTPRYLCVALPAFDWFRLLRLRLVRLRTHARFGYRFILGYAARSAVTTVAFAVTRFTHRTTAVTTAHAVVLLLHCRLVTVAHILHTFRLLRYVLLPGSLYAPPTAVYPFTHVRIPVTGYRALLVSTLLTPLPPLVARLPLPHILRWLRLPQYGSATVATCIYVTGLCPLVAFTTTHGSVPHTYAPYTRIRSARLRFATITFLHTCLRTFGAPTLRFCGSFTVLDFAVLDRWVPTGHTVGTTPHTPTHGCRLRSGTFYTGLRSMRAVRILFVYIAGYRSPFGYIPFVGSFTLHLRRLPLFTFGFTLHCYCGYCPHGSRCSCVAFGSTHSFAFVYVHLYRRYAHPYTVGYVDFVSFVCLVCTHQFIPVWFARAVPRCATHTFTVTTV